ncbi:phage portal protein [Gluconobacter frateurii]|uniref:Phage portal protein n=1 Tax=Gluconobacter frateurii NRIC 0228 TaxID=1307946 RepID=A0ABQ0QDC7_9PROT|nr:phage portal protein [Gluconobacter frateurii]GBR14117.1 phage portal protein [Gluconobacter frateurii NRIC 0228]GLP92009.1 histone H1 [Gluconobacter frateurii]
MNFIQKALNLKTKASVIPEVPITTGLPFMMGGGLSATGITVNYRTALQHNAVYTCVRTLTSDIAKIPLTLEQFVDGGWQKATNHPLCSLLSVPNERLVMFEFLEEVIKSVLLTGDAFVVVIRDRQGNPIRLIPIRPGTASVVEDPKDGELFYKVTDNQLIPLKTSVSSETGPTRTIFHSDMIRTRNLSFDGGIYGQSLIQIASEAFGLSLATQETAARAFKNGANINGYFTSNGSTGREQQLSNKEELTRAISSIVNTAQPAIINGLDWVPMNNSVEQLQLTEARKQTVIEVAQMFRIPLYKLGQSDGEKAANISEQEQSYITNTLIQYTRPLEQHMDRVLLNDNEKAFFRFKFDFSKQAEPDEKVRGSYYKDALTNGWMTPNEIRKREELPPSTQDGADELRFPLNTGVIGSQEPEDYDGVTNEEN